MQPKNSFKYLLVSLVASFLTVVLMFVGAPLLRVLHNVYGSKLYWLTALLFGGALWLMGAEVFAFLMFSVWVVIGLYGELEKRGQAGFFSALIAVLAGTAITVYGPIFWAQAQGLEFGSILEGMINQWLSGMQTQGAAKLEAKTLIDQMPSMLAILHTCNLAFALMFDRRAGRAAKLRFEKIATSLKLLEFRLPDWMIWVMMLSFAFGFVDLGNKDLSRVGLNIFNVSMGFYLFQGLAVLEAAFLVFRVGSFLKALLYIFVVGQLFFLLSGVGVIDYWVDFRKRLKKWRSRKNRQKKEEHI